MSVQKVVRGGLWLYIDTILTYSIGYIYWLIISRIGGASIVGYASTAISLAIILQTIALLGIPIGLQRFIGKSFGKKRYSELKSYFASSLTFSTITLASTCILIYLLLQPLHNITHLDNIYIILAILLLLFTGINLTLKNFLISIIYITNILIADITANSIRLFLGVLLVLKGWGGVGATAGYVFSALTGTILLSFYSTRVLRKFGEGKTKITFKFINDVLKAGFASWLPQVITIIGTQIAVLAVFGFRGAAEAGIYYVAQAILGIVLALPTSLLGLLFPVLSGMDNGRKKATWKIIRISLATSVPISIVAIIYSKFILGLLGQEFTAGWLILSILCLSIPLACIVQGVISLTYAIGLYSMVLTIGLVMSTTRVTLYFLLVPTWGGIGASISFLTGFLTGFFASIYIAHKVKFTIEWKSFITITSIPALIGLLIYLPSLPFYLGIPIILFGTTIAYTRLRVITREDLSIIAKAILPQELIKQIIPKVNPILKILFGE